MMLLGIIINAVILMVAIKAFTDEDVGFFSSALLGLGASIVAAVVAVALVVPLGLTGALIAASVVTAAVVGVAVSAMYGIEIKRSMLVGVIFLVANVAIGMFFNAMVEKATAPSAFMPQLNSLLALV